MISVAVLAPLVAATPYTSRVLPPDEWPSLAGTEAAAAWPHLDPTDTRVLVVERAGVIVGTWIVLRMVHVECVWIHPDHRGRIGVVKRLIAGMRELARAWGATTVLTGATTDTVRGLIDRLGGIRLDGESYVIPLNGEGACPRQF